MKYFTVGPSQLYPIVPESIVKALRQGILSVSHRSKTFNKLFKDTTENLRLLLSIPSDYSIFFLSSGTECMERIIQNMVKQNSLHFINGSFSNRFYQIGIELGKKSKKIESAYVESFHWDTISIPKITELLCFTHNETSTGVMLPLDKIYEIRQKNENMLIAIDVVSSIPYVDIEFTKVDAVFFSVQKGFGLPTGLGVLILSPRAIEKSLFLEKSKTSTGSYHSFQSFIKYAQKYQTPETPNVLDIFLLNEVIKHMLVKGINLIRQEIDTKARMINVHVDNNQELNYLSENFSNRSKTIHVLKVLGGAKKMIKQLEKKALIVSAGYNQMKEDFIRISNYPAHSIKDMKFLLKSISE